MTTPSHSDETHTAAPEKVTTAGLRAHNELTYRGVDFLLNSTIGVATTFWTSRTESGKNWFSNPVTNFFTKLLTPILKTPEKIAQGAKRGSMFVSIIVGGAAIIPPMVMLEKKENKKAIVRWFDELIYGKEQVATDPKFKEVLDAIDTEPHKDFATGMAARFAVLTPMIAATVNPSVDKYLMEWLYNPIAKGSKLVAEGIGIKPKKLIERGAMELAEGDVSKAPKFVSDWDFIHRTIGFDFGLTAIYAFAHEFTYKAFAAFRHEEAETPTKLPAAEPPVAPIADTSNPAPHWSKKAPQPDNFVERSTAAPTANMGVA